MAGWPGFAVEVSAKAGPIGALFDSTIRVSTALQPPVCSLVWCPTCLVIARTVVHITPVVCDRDHNCLDRVPAAHEHNGRPGVSTFKPCRNPMP